MADLKRATDDLATRAALAAGKDAAKRFAGGLMSDDEEGAPKDAERAAASKSRRNKLIAYGVVGLLIVFGVLGLVVSYWHWFLLLGALGLGGLYGWHRIRKRFASKDKPEETPGAKAKPRVTGARAREDQGEESGRARPAPERKRVELPRAEPVLDAAARDKAQAVEQQELDDELAALKARLNK